MASSSAASNINANPTMAQYSADANLMAEFEKSDESGKSFNYARSVTGAAHATEEQITAYLSRIQRGGHVQPFGCLLAIEESTFKIIGYSENCFDMLGLKSVVESKGVKGLIGVDARSLFAPSSRGSLTKAVSTRDISLLNPVWVHSKSNRKPFYAILHRIDVGTVIDLEPAHSGDPTMLHASAVQSQKLAVKVISRLQSLPGGDIGVLCDTVVENVQKLTGYDRVMVYKFHDDDHGEVVSEIIRSDLEPFFGLHYPATDIPQAARFLFKQNRVRMICDCNAQPVKIIQTEELKQPLCLVNSTLRAPHGCHMQYMVNMGSIASLAMAVLINNGDSMKLWGLVVCHHTSPRYIPFPLRYACEFLIQAFNLQLYMELQLAAQLAEKNILRMQTLLCDMLLRDAPFGIMTQSPSIMDLVKCDGAALYYQGKCWLLGVTPAEAQIIDIAEWLLTNHGDSTGLSTESLADAGYPGAALLGDRVCGMAMARITSTDFLFWFRSHTAKEIKWAGAKHLPESEDDGRKMHPRSSFNVFLEIVKSRSLSWEVTEINAIHSLQLILRGSLDESSPEFVSYPQHYDGGPGQLRELTSVAVEMVRLIETARVPIFGVDSSGLVNGWNAKMCELTGLKASEALGKSLVIDVIHEDSHKVVEAMMRRALQGVEDKNIEVKLLNFGAQESNSVIYLLVNACTSRDYKNDVVGVCFVGHDVTAEKNVMDKFTLLQGDYKAIIQSLNPLVPPIFASDVSACCAEWNAAMEKLTGWTRDQVIGKMLPGDIFGSLCHLKSDDALTKFMVLLYRAISGQENEKIPFGFFNRKGEPIDVFLSANKRADKSGNVIGCLCFMQIAVDQQQSRIDKQENRKRLSELKELAYIKQEMRNPLSGIRFTHKLLEGSAVTDDQKQFLETSNACERQLLSIIDDTNFGSLDYCGKMELKMEEFLLGNVVDAIVSQAMILLNEKNLRFMHEIPEQIKTLSLYGDRIRLQSALSNFLIRTVDYAPSRDGWVEIKISPELKLVRDGNEYVRLQFRMTHPGQGLPYTIIEDMFSTKNHLTTEEGFALNISQKLLAMMHGNVRYMRDQTKCYFLIDVELELHKSRQRSSSLNRSR